MGQCLFCEIVAGNVPCDEVFSDDDILAFRDINPQGPVHILVIPRQHVPGMKVLSDADAPSLGRLLVVASRIAAQEGLDRDGYRCVINTGPDNVSLELLKPMIQRCQLLITNDTGPRHYAVSFDVPVVVIMGPTDPRYTNANLEKTIVLRRDIDCAPCHQKECALHHECMAEILPQEVMGAIEQLLPEDA